MTVLSETVKLLILNRRPKSAEDAAHPTRSVKKRLKTIQLIQAGFRLSSFDRIDLEVNRTIVNSRTLHFDFC